MSAGVLGIIAGSGNLPLKLAQACRDEGRECFIIAIEDAAAGEWLDQFPHARVRIGAVGDTLNYLRTAAAEEVVLAGGIKRPSVAALMPDAMGAKLIARLGLKLFSGDDALLSALVQFLEEEGFRVVGADEVLGSLVAPEGVLTRLAPDKQAKEDIALGFKAARALGELDIGQAAVVENGIVLGLEGAEGTDALIARCETLAKDKKRAVLVKTAKPEQEKRADLPSFGPQTVENLHRAGFLGFAFGAGTALLLDREETVKLADQYGMFIAGIAE